MIVNKPLAKFVFLFSDMKQSINDLSDELDDVMKEIEDIQGQVCRT